MPLPFVVLSDREEIGDVALAMSSGVQGYIFTGIDSRFAFQALSFILHGGIYFPPSAIAGFHRENSGISGKISEDVDQEIKSSASEINDRGNGESQENGAESITLTHRQKEVLDHIRLGESNKVIARHLGMTEGTVKVHVRQIMRKAGVSNRTQLAVRNVVHASHDRN